MTTFILIVIGALLIVLNVRAVSKDKTAKSTFQGILEHTDSEIDDFDVKIGELRREFSETILELQKEIVALKDLYEEDRISISNVENENDFEDVRDIEVLNQDDKAIKIIEKKAKPKKQTMKKGTKANKNSDLGINEKYIDDDNKNKKINLNINEVKSDINVETTNSNHNSVKINEIEKLINEGMSVDEVSEKLGVGKGEVLLIKDLYIK